MGKTLKKSNNKLIAGCCAGIAEYFNLDVTLVRLAYAAFSLFSAGFPGVLLYLVMCIVMPPSNES